MAISAVVFSGRNGLDFSELRGGVLRIPDVTLRVREAQRILDGLDLPKVDLFNVIAADDDSFFRNIKLKSLASAIVQVGLYDRLTKTQRKPDFMVGNSNGDSALLVCAGLQTFEEMVSQSPALDTLKPSEKVILLGAEPAPLLAGLSLTEYQALGCRPGSDGKSAYVPVKDGLMDIKKVVAYLYTEQGATRFISVGPAGALRGSDYQSLGSDEIESIDSIELDPMLGWFWRNMRPQSSALAQ